MRQETCYAETECCLIGINKGKLSVLQKNLLEKGNSKDYFIIESTLKGNYLLKTNWRRDILEGTPNQLAGGQGINLEQGSRVTQESQTAHVLNRAIINQNQT